MKASDSTRKLLLLMSKVSLSRRAISSHQHVAILHSLTTLSTIA